MKKILITLALLTNFGAQAAVVSLTPSVAESVVGDEFTISVSAADFSEVAGATLELIFNPDLVEIVSMSQTGDFDPLYDPNSRSLNLLSPLIPNFTVSDEFDILDIVMKSIAEGSAEITFNDGGLNGWFDNAAQKVNGITYDSANVNISAVPVPAAIWLFGSALMGIAGISRRKV